MTSTTETKPKRTRVLYPFLFAMWPIFQLWADNPDEVRTKDALLAGGAVLGVVVVLYLLGRLILRNPLKAGLILGLTVLVFFSYSAIHDQIDALNNVLGWESLAGPLNPVRHRYVFALLAALLGPLFLWIAFTRRNLGPVTRLGNTVGLVLVAMTIGRIGLGKMAIARAAEGAQAELAARSAQAEELPDIYYIVLDRYASLETFQERYGYDNSGFYRELEERGFVVRDCMANYAMTTLQVSANLQMDYHGENVRLGNVIHDMSEGHTLGRFLKKQGYRYYHLPSWTTPTKICRIADKTFNLPGEKGSEFSIALGKMTPLRVFPYFSAYEFEVQADTALYQFDLLPKLVNEPGPRFVVAHILMPHPPFVFNRDGKRITTGGTTYDENSRKHFLEHLRYTNKRMREIVDGILANSARPPVIVIQGDEGPYLRGDDVDQDKVTQQKIRSGVISAVLLPGAKPEALRAMRTPVNTFRIVLNTVFGAELELLEDKVLSWYGMLRPVEPSQTGYFEFEDISARLIN